VVVAVVAAIVGSGAVILFVDTGTAAGAAVALESTTDPGTDPFTRSVAIGEVATAVVVAPITRTVTADLPADPTTGGLRASGNAPGLYGGTGDTHTCDPTRLADFLTHTPGKAAAWAGVLGISTRAIPSYVGTLTPVVLTTDTRVTNHGYRDGHATTFQAVLQAGTAVLVDRSGIPRVKCGCGNPLTEPVAQPIATTTGTPWRGYDPGTVTTVSPSPRPQASLTLTDVTTGDTYSEPTGGGGGTGTVLAASYGEDGESTLLRSTDGGRTWSPQPASTSGPYGDGPQLAHGGGRWLAVGQAHQGGMGYITSIQSSTDGRSWDRAAQLQDALSDAAYGDGRWLAVGGSVDQTGTTPPHGTIYVSTDGQRWALEESSGLPTSTELDQWTWQSIAFGNGRWAGLANECSHAVATGILHCQNQLFRSDDGHRWTDTGRTFAGYSFIRFGGGRWVVTGPAAADQGSQLVIETSSDLATWQPATVPVPAGSDPEHGPRPPVIFTAAEWLLAANADFSQGPAQVFTSRDARRWTAAGSQTLGLDSLASTGG
jgi:hypothetical protein